MSRRYELKQRAQRQAETRRRIVHAAVELHTSEGPARTTISAIAERAGVERHTVYAHFPDERSLFEACADHWSALHPFPDGPRWATMKEPERRLRAALEDVYSWYELVADELAVLKRDAQVHAITAELLTRDGAALVGLGETLAADWPRRKAVRAAIAHALELETWQSLVQRNGLTRRQAADAMLAFVASV
jgi:AcrR family transcriptional regulator